MILKLIFSFFGRYWQYLLPALIVTFLYIQYSHAINKAKELQRVLDGYTAEVVRENKRIDTEIKASEALTKAQIQTKEAEYQALFKLHKLDRSQSKALIEKVKHYEKHLNDLSSPTDNRVCDNVRAVTDQQNTESNTDTAGSSEGGGKCDTALAGVIAACKITTIDYNRCRAILDADTKLFGRQSW